MERVLSNLTKALKVFLIGLMAFIIIVDLAEIVSRQFGGSIPWAFPLTLLIFVWLTFIGIVVVYYESGNIRISFLTKRMPQKFHKHIEAFTHFVVAFFMLFILSNAPRMIAMQHYGIELLPGPRYLFSVPIFAGSLMILVIAIHRIYAKLRYGEMAGEVGNGNGGHEPN